MSKGCVAGVAGRILLSMHCWLHTIYPRSCTVRPGVPPPEWHLLHHSGATSEAGIVAGHGNHFPAFSGGLAPGAQLLRRRRALRQFSPAILGGWSVTHTLHPHRGCTSN